MYRFIDDIVELVAFTPERLLAVGRAVWIVVDRQVQLGRQLQPRDPAVMSHPIVGGDLWDDCS